MYLGVGGLNLPGERNGNPFQFLAEKIPWTEEDNRKEEKFRLCLKTRGPGVVLTSPSGTRSPALGCGLVLPGVGAGTAPGHAPL